MASTEYAAVKLADHVCKEMEIEKKAHKCIY